MNEDTLFSIVKYIFEKEGRAINATNLNSFVNNGLSFPKFAAILANVYEIPGIKNKFLKEKTKKENNIAAIDFINRKCIECYKLYPENLFSSFYPRLIEQILFEIYFKKPTFQEIFSQSIILFKTIDIEIHKEREIYTGLYIIRLLHILTDRDVQLIDEFNNSTDIENILSPIFSKYNIPFFLNSQSFEYDQQRYTLLQYKIIFDKYQEKIKSILKSNKDQYNSIKQENITKEESIFLNLVNIVGKDLGITVYNFDEIIESGFIPKFFKLYIDSTENITFIEDNSIDAQIKNIETIINYMRKDNPSIDYHLFDFKTQSTRKFSIIYLVKFMMNRYFLKSTKQEMNSRFNRIINRFTKDKFDNNYIFVIAFFYINGHSKITESDYRNKNYLLIEHNIPCIMNFSSFTVDDYYYYQLQILYDLIDKRESLHVIEKLKDALCKINKIIVPKYFTVKSPNKTKPTFNCKILKNQEIVGEIEEEEEEEIVKTTIEINKNPTTFKDRFKKEMNSDQSTNEQRKDQVQIETPEQFWKPEKLLNAHFENGILVSTEQKRDEPKSLEKWDENIKKIQEIATNEKQEPINNQSSFDIPHSGCQSKLYKIFYYNEEKNRWFFIGKSFDCFSEDMKIAKDAHIPLLCYIDSNEEDLISINSNFIGDNYPKFDDHPNEIFVYALCDKSLSNLNCEADSLSKNKSSISPIIFLIHVPKEKENRPDIKSIIMQIYTFLSLICDIRIIVLDKSFYETQVLNLRCIFNIVDKNINELMKKNDDKKIDSDEMIYKQSKTIVLINDKSIKNANTDMENNIKNSDLFSNINSMFDNQIIMHIINIEDQTTYKSLLDSFNSICLENKNTRSEIYHNFMCIKDVINMSYRYISIMQSIDDTSSIIKSNIEERFSFFESNNDPLSSINFVHSEILDYSPKFDLFFYENCVNTFNDIINDKTKFNPDILKRELKQSAKENLEYYNYQFNKSVCGELTFEKLKRSHLTFLNKEYLDIIKILVDDIFVGYIYEKNINILNEQIENDLKIIPEIFSPYFKQFEIKEANFDEVKQKGTSYVMKETESIREVKITLQMKEDLKTIIEQDF